MRKPHETFRKIIQYCKLMNYDVNDILEMSDNELRLWYHRTLDMINNETEFRIRTGMSIDNQGKAHKVVAVVDGRICKK